MDKIMETAKEREIAFEKWYVEEVKGTKGSATSYINRLRNVVNLIALQGECEENLFEYDNPIDFAISMAKITNTDIFVQEDEICDSQISTALTLYMNFLKHNIIVKIISSLSNIERLSKTEKEQVQALIDVLEEINTAISLKEKNKWHTDLPSLDSIKIRIENMKEGLIARSVLRSLLKCKLFSPEEIKRLQNREECRTRFSLSYPVLILSEDKQNYLYDIYYAQPIQIGEMEYMICNDWHEKSKKQLVDYINNVFMEFILT